ncbi:hypothetical protein LCGC14_2688940, partial [marine sediment metagenome]
MHILFKMATDGIYIAKIALIIFYVGEVMLTMSMAHTQTVGERL